MPGLTQRAPFPLYFQKLRMSLGSEVAQNENFPFLPGFAILKMRRISMKPDFIFMQIDPGSLRRSSQWAQDF